MMKRRLWWWIGVVLVLAAGLGLRDPWSPDEPRFAMVAVDMVESGQWLIPYTADFPYPDKPPLFMWLIASLLSITGSLRLSFLLPSLIASLVSIFLVWDLARRLWSPRVAMVAVMAQMTVLQFIVQAGSAQIDAVLGMWTTLGLYGMCRHFLIGPAWGWYTVAGVAMGLGIITKGVGFLPLLVLIPGLIMAGRGWRRCARVRVLDIRWVLAPAAMLLVVACWLVPMLMYVNASGNPAMEAYRDNILVKQTAKRYAASWHHHKHPFYFPLEVIPSLWMPLAALLPWFIPAWWRRIRRGDARFALPLAWICLVIIFFSIPSGKRGVYLLPAVPAFALIAAPILVAVSRRPLIRWVAKQILELGIVAALFGCGLVAYRVFVDAEPPPWSLPIVFVGFLALGVVFLIWRLQVKRLGAPLAFACAFWTVLALGGWIGRPIANPQISAKPFMVAVGEKIGPQAELGLLFWKEQFYLFRDREVAVFGYRTFTPEEQHEELMAAMRWMLAEPGRWILGPASVLENPENTLVIEDRGWDMGERHRERWLLVNRDHIDPSKWGIFLPEQAALDDPAKANGNKSSSAGNTF